MSQIIILILKIFYNWNYLHPLYPVIIKKGEQKICASVKICEHHTHSHHSLIPSPFTLFIQSSSNSICLKAKVIKNRKVADHQ